MENIVNIHTIKYEGINHFVFEKTRKGEIIFKVFMDGVEFLTRKENNLLSTESFFDYKTIQIPEYNDDFIMVTKFTIKDEYSNFEEILEKEELFNKIKFVVDKQNLNQERVLEIENNLNQLGYSYEDGRKLLMTYLFADENTQKEIYSKFLKELENSPKQ